ncbi:MAG TPA: NAD-dependent epimerase/dehydratase family protein [bacterium]|nr:NAD-dependent epimerase/dehydratase family protein [bacterium]
MKILVTGGAGFIGSHIVDSFIGQGHDVVVADNLTTGQTKNLNPKAAFYLMDIRAAELGKLFEQERPDAVCHQAAQMDVRKSVADPLYDADVNIRGTLNLLQNCVKNGVGKFLFASTGGAIYGEQEAFPCDESHPTRPVSPYGVAKQTVERYLHYYQVEYGLTYSILRYANIYGPRQNPAGEAGVVAIFADRLLRGRQPVINGDGKQTRDYTYVGDVARANLLCLARRENEIFNIGTGMETDVNTLFHMLNEITGGKAKEVHGPAAPGEQRRSVISSQKAGEKIGWEPETDLRSGLRETVAFFSRNTQ